MIGPDVVVRADGSVAGTFLFVPEFPEFNKADPAEQSGYYFPFLLTKKSKNGKMTLKSNGVTKPEKKDIPYDPEIIFRVGSKQSTFTVELDGEDYITLSFAGATFKPQ